MQERISVLIAIDIGNSSIHIGYFTDRGLFDKKISTHPLKGSDEYSKILNDFLEENHIEKKLISGIISSVVESHTAVLAEAITRLSGEKKPDIFIVSHEIKSGMVFRVKAPDQMGADRIANAAGAYEIYKDAVAVIDFGTATTITVVDREAACIGGAIMPGVGLMNEMLEKGTSKLRRVLLEPPQTALGKDTSGSILSGLFYGCAGAVERILSEIEKETGLSLHVVVTGGYGGLMAKYIMRSYDSQPLLILRGLKLLYEKNRHS